MLEKTGETTDVRREKKKLGMVRREKVKEYKDPIISVGSRGFSRVSKPIGVHIKATGDNR